MKKEKKFVFRIDTKTQELLSGLEEKTGNAKSVVIRNLIWQAAGQLTGKGLSQQQGTKQG